MKLKNVHNQKKNAPSLFLFWYSPCNTSAFCRVLPLTIMLLGDAHQLLLSKFETAPVGSWRVVLALPVVDLPLLLLPLSPSLFISYASPLLSVAVVLLL